MFLILLMTYSYVFHSLSVPHAWAWRPVGETDGGEGVGEKTADT